jgi:Flp pilus assembly protein TadG
MNFNKLVVRKLQRLLRSATGSAAALGAIFIAVIVGVAGLAVDIGHLVVVKSELQRAADAGAIAGARAYASYQMGVVQLVNWDEAQNKAEEVLLGNTSDGQRLTSYTIEVGYWNLASKTLQSKTITPTSQDVPAVRTSVSRSVAFFLASILRVASGNADVQAIAALPAGGPSAVPPGGCFPLATPESWVNSHLDSRTSFKIYSTYHDDDGGQWTSFLQDENNVTYIRGLMNDGNPDSVNIGDPIYIQPGTKATLYSDASNFIGETVLIPVVMDNFETHDYTPIKGFVAFKIEATDQGAKWIQGHFEKNYVAPSSTSSSSSPFYGTWASSPKLVK